MADKKHKIFARQERGKKPVGVTVEANIEGIELKEAIIQKFSPLLQSTSTMSSTSSTASNSNNLDSFKIATASLFILPNKFRGSPYVHRNHLTLKSTASVDSLFFQLLDRDSILVKIRTNPQSAEEEDYQNSDEQKMQQQADIIQAQVSKLNISLDDVINFDLKRTGKLVEQERQLVSTKGETFESLVKTIIKRDGKNVIALIGKVGCGKSCNIFDIASKEFVIYIDCHTELEIVYKTFEEEVLKKIGGKFSNLEEALSAQKLIRESCNVIFGRELFLRLFHLNELLDSYKEELTPKNFIDDHFNGARTRFEEIRKYTLLFQNGNENAINLIKELVQELKSKLKTRGLGLFVALDETESSISKYSDYIISASAIENIKSLPEYLKKRIWDRRKHCINPRYQRSILQVFCNTIQFYGLPVIVAGSSLNLADSQRISIPPAERKDHEVFTIIDFPICEEPSKICEATLNISGCEIPKEKYERIRGNYRNPMMMLMFVPMLIRRKPQYEKNNTISDALDLTAEQMKSEIIIDVMKFIRVQPFSMSRLFQLKKIVMGYNLCGSSYIWKQSEVLDLLTKRMFTIVKINYGEFDSAYVCVNEHLVIEALEQFVNGGTETVSELPITNSLKTLNVIKGIWGITQNPANKGTTVFENLVYQTLKGFNGMKISEMAFVKGLKLPEWCKKTEFKFDRIENNSINNNQVIEFLSNRVSGVILKPNENTQQSGIWFFSRDYAGSLAIKFYGSEIERAIHDETVELGDIRKQKQQGRIIQETKIDELKGMLRIHIELPNTVQSVICQSRVEGEDVLVFITKENLADFFYSNVSNNQSIMDKLKKLLSICF